MTNPNKPEILNRLRGLHPCTPSDWESRIRECQQASNLVREHMINSLPRLLLATSGVLLFFGGVVHAVAFKKAVSTVGNSNLDAFYANALKGLWLIDSATLVTLAIVLGLIAARPAIASGAVVAVLALIPAATAGLLYYFIGAFMPAHLNLAAAALALCGGLLLVRARPGVSANGLSAAVIPD
ncbi:MAG: hypothetical protein E6H78_08640 [Betaproteobacteria bacterium]|nr:MAG: hypothetical protein E6H78_08640 [Betaproteobacteria bacterium]